METGMYAEMAELEKKHWWFVGRRRVVMDIARRYFLHTGPLLDVGLGTGFNAEQFAQAGYVVEGLEPAEAGIAYVKKRLPDMRIFEALFPAAEIPSDRYASLLLLDTLEHIEDDVAALRDVKRVLANGGRALITVPAFGFLWTKHDERAHHFRRYRKRELVRVIREAGLEPEFVSYYNFFLFLPIALVRLVTKVLGKEEGSDFEKSPAFLNPLFTALFSAEKYPLRITPLPFGVSLIAVVRKK